MSLNEDRQEVLWDILYKNFGKFFTYKELETLTHMPYEVLCELMSPLAGRAEDEDFFLTVSCPGNDYVVGLTKDPAEALVSMAFLNRVASGVDKRARKAERYVDNKISELVPEYGPLVKLFKAARKVVRRGKEELYEAEADMQKEMVSILRTLRKPPSPRRPANPALGKAAFQKLMSPIF